MASSSSSDPGIHLNITGYGVVTDPRIHEFTVFIMTVQANGMHSWTIYRRGDSFLALSEQLRSIVRMTPSCPHPIACDPRSVESMERARVQLTGWIWQLLQLPNVIQSRPFQEFINTEANLPPPMLQSKSFHLDDSGGFGEMDVS